jgi:hypothetical protein
MRTDSPKREGGLLKVALISGVFFAGVVSPTRLMPLVQSLRATDEPAARPAMWFSAEDKFGARFPSTPDRLDASSPLGHGYAYQSVTTTATGGTLFAITVMPPQPVMVSPSTQLEKDRLLRLFVDDFASGLGVSPDQVTIRFKPFGRGQRRLEYSFRFIAEGVEFIAEGYSIISAGRLIRVSVAFTSTLSEEEVRTAHDFLGSFAVVDE